MQIFLTIVFLILGLLILVKGADWMVQGASRGAQILKISPLIIGLSIVAIGTSLPELAVSLTAVLSGSGDISVGNIIGSNICNIALALGITSIILPLSVSKSALKRDFPIMIGTAILLLLFGKDNKLARWEGIVFLIILTAYYVYLAKRKEVFIPEQGKKYTGWIEKYPWLAIFLGIVGIAIGAKLMVEKGIEIAVFFGVSEAIIGLTIMAIGTSLPELVTSIVAAIRKEPELSLGNILGSNILNIALVLGCVGTIRPINIEPRLFNIDIWVMLAYSFILLPLLLTKYKLSRKEGGFLAGTYIIYLIYLYSCGMVE